MSKHSKKIGGRLLAGFGLLNQIETYDCRVMLHDLERNVKEEKSSLLLKSDSREKTYTLNRLKLTAKLDLHESGRSVSAYWANRRAITLSITDLKNRIQAQLNNTVESKTGPFDYQTQTTQYSVKLHCDPVSKIVVSK